MGNDIVSDARKNLKTRKKDKNSSGKLSRSLSSKVDADGNELTIYAEDYAEFVDQGTKDSSGNDFLTDAVNNNINEYGDKLTEAVGDDIIVKIDIIFKDK